MVLGHDTLRNKDKWSKWNWRLLSSTIPRLGRWPWATRICLISVLTWTTPSLFIRRRVNISEKAMAPHSSTLAGKSHGQRSLVGCSPWGREEWDTTEWLHFHFSLSCTGEGNGNPLQCSCLENPRDGGAWWVAISGVTQSRTQLKQLSSSSSSRVNI